MEEKRNPLTRFIEDKLLPLMMNFTFLIPFIITPIFIYGVVQGSWKLGEFLQTVKSVEKLWI